MVLEDRKIAVQTENHSSTAFSYHRQSVYLYACADIGGVYNNVTMILLLVLFLVCVSTISIQWNAHHLLA